MAAQEVATKPQSSPAVLLPLTDSSTIDNSANGHDETPQTLPIIPKSTELRDVDENGVKATENEVATKENVASEHIFNGQETADETISRPVEDYAESTINQDADGSVQPTVLSTEENVSTDVPVIISNEQVIDDSSENNSTGPAITYDDNTNTTDDVEAKLPVESAPEEVSTESPSQVQVEAAHSDVKAADTKENPTVSDADIIPSSPVPAHETLSSNHLEDVPDTITVRDADHAEEELANTSQPNPGHTVEPTVSETPAHDHVVVEPVTADGQAAINDIEAQDTASEIKPQDQGPTTGDLAMNENTTIIEVASPSVQTSEILESLTQSYEATNDIGSEITHTDSIPVAPKEDLMPPEAGAQGHLTTHGQFGVAELPDAQASSDNLGAEDDANSTLAESPMEAATTLGELVEDSKSNPEPEQVGINLALSEQAQETPLLKEVASELDVHHDSTPAPQTDLEVESKVVDDIPHDSPQVLAQEDELDSKLVEASPVTSLVADEPVKAEQLPSFEHGPEVQVAPVFSSSEAPVEDTEGPPVVSSPEVALEPDVSVTLEEQSQSEPVEAKDEVVEDSAVVSLEPHEPAEEVPQSQAEVNEPSELEEPEVVPEAQDTSLLNSSQLDEPSKPVDAAVPDAPNNQAEEGAEATDNAPAQADLELGLVAKAPSESESGSEPLEVVKESLNLPDVGIIPGSDVLIPAHTHETLSSNHLEDVQDTITVHDTDPGNISQSNLEHAVGPAASGIVVHDHGAAEPVIVDEQAVINDIEAQDTTPEVTPPTETSVQTSDVSEFPTQSYPTTNELGSETSPISVAPKEDLLSAETEDEVVSPATRATEAEAPDAKQGSQASSDNLGAEDDASSSSANPPLEAATTLEESADNHEDSNSNPEPEQVGIDSKVALPEQAQETSLLKEVTSELDVHHDSTPAPQTNLEDESKVVDDIPHESLQVPAQEDELNSKLVEEASPVTYLVPDEPVEAEQLPSSEHKLEAQVVATLSSSEAPEGQSQQAPVGDVVETPTVSAELGKASEELAGQTPEGVDQLSSPKVVLEPEVSETPEEQSQSESVETKGEVVKEAPVVSAQGTSFPESSQLFEPKSIDTAVSDGANNQAEEHIQAENNVAAQAKLEQELVSEVPPGNSQPESGTEPFEEVKNTPAFSLELAGSARAGAEVDASSSSPELEVEGASISEPEEQLKSVDESVRESAAEVPSEDSHPGGETETEGVLAEAVEKTLSLEMHEPTESVGTETKVDTSPSDAELEREVPAEDISLPAASQQDEQAKSEANPEERSQNLEPVQFEAEEAADGVSAPSKEEYQSIQVEQTRLFPETEIDRGTPGISERFSLGLETAEAESPLQQKHDELAAPVGDELGSAERDLLQSANSNDAGDIGIPEAQKPVEGGFEAPVMILTAQGHAPDDASDNILPSGAGDVSQQTVEDDAQGRVTPVGDAHIHAIVDVGGIEEAPSEAMPQNGNEVSTNGLLVDKTLDNEVQTAVIDSYSASPDSAIIVENDIKVEVSPGAPVNGEDGQKHASAEFEPDATTIPEVSMLSEASFVPVIESHPDGGAQMLAMVTNETETQSPEEPAPMVSDAAETTTVPLAVLAPNDEADGSAASAGAGEERPSELDPGLRDISKVVQPEPISTENILQLRSTITANEEPRVGNPLPDEAKHEVLPNPELALDPAPLGSALVDDRIIDIPVVHKFTSDHSNDTAEAYKSPPALGDHIAPTTHFAIQSDLSEESSPPIDENLSVLDQKFGKASSSPSPSLLPSDMPLPTRPRSPWTPSYSVTTQGPGIIPEDEIEPEPLSNEQLPTVSLTVPTDPVASTDEATAGDSSGRGTWTPSYTVFTQGSPLQKTVNIETGSRPTTEKPTQDTVQTADQLPASLQNEPVADQKPDSEVQQTVLPIKDEEETGALDVSNEVPDLAVKVPFPSVTLADEYQQTSKSKLSLNIIQENIEDHAVSQHLDAEVSPSSPRSRLESTASSLFFPGGWFAKIPEGRPSLDNAHGVFTPSKPVPAVVEPQAAESPESPREDNEKKGRWCIVM